MPRRRRHFRDLCLRSPVWADSLPACRPVAGRSAGSSRARHHPRLSPHRPGDLPRPPRPPGAPRSTLRRLRARRRTPPDRLPAIHSQRLCQTGSPASGVGRRRLPAWLPTSRPPFARPVSPDPRGRYHDRCAAASAGRAGSTDRDLAPAQGLGTAHACPTRRRARKLA